MHDRIAAALLLTRPSGTRQPAVGFYTPINLTDSDLWTLRSMYRGRTGYFGDLWSTEDERRALDTDGGRYRCGTAPSRSQQC
jgi:hypothetical protein